MAQTVQTDWIKQQGDLADRMKSIANEEINSRSESKKSLDSLTAAINDLRTWLKTGGDATAAMEIIAGYG